MFPESGLGQSAPVIASSSPLPVNPATPPRSASLTDYLPYIPINTSHFRLVGVHHFAGIITLRFEVAVQLPDQLVLLTVQSRVVETDVLSGSTTWTSRVGRSDYVAPAPPTRWYPEGRPWTEWDRDA